MSKLEPGWVDALAKQSRAPKIEELPPLAQPRPRVRSGFADKMQESRRRGGQNARGRKPLRKAPFGG